MRFRLAWAVAAVLSLALLASCGGSKFKTYNGPEVTRVVVMKGQRKMYLLHGRKVLKDFDVDLGFSPVGPKQFEGDGRTPEGSYYIDRRNPRSQFHLSLGISYPNAEDIAAARAAGRSPGGDIMLHGGRRPIDSKAPDWTWGCISVSDKDIETVYAMVPDGTQVDIFP
jgi:murein L,D-transpeptidase YafK